MSIQNTQNGVTEAQPGFFSRWWRRILFHILGLFLLGCMSESLPKTKLIDDLSVGIYLGFICLLHRGVGHEKNWYIPTLFGVIQGGLLFFLGMPLYACIFWGGVQSWLQRVIRCWDHMGGEWIILPLLIMMASDYFTSQQLLPFPLWPLYTLLPIAVAGYVANTLYQRIQRENIYKETLSTTFRRLQSCCESKKLAGDLQKHVSIILAQAMTFERLAPHSSDRGREIISNLDIASKHLAKHLSAPSVMMGGWSSELFKGETWHKLTGKQNADSLEATFRKCTQELIAFIRTATPNNHDTSAIDSLLVFEQQARQILAKTGDAPAKIAKEIEAIALLTFEIIKGMRDDPRDRPAGERFLQRYLPAAEHIADEYTRLILSNSKREDVSFAVRRAEEVLSRLHKAFSEELSAMLANDSASFTAELNALDKLLKMSGH